MIGQFQQHASLVLRIGLALHQICLLETPRKLHRTVMPQDELFREIADAHGPTHESPDREKRLEALGRQAQAGAHLFTVGQDVAQRAPESRKRSKARRVERVTGDRTCLLFACSPDHPAPQHKLWSFCHTLLNCCSGRA